MLPQAWEVEQEKNLLYVAWTRARNGLYFLDWSERSEVSTADLVADIFAEQVDSTGSGIEIIDAKYYRPSATSRYEDYLYLVRRVKDTTTGLVTEKRFKPWERRWKDILWETRGTVIDEEEKLRIHG